ncbi:MAG: hypothetical protein OXM87_13090 [Truepera sp.]|nr:hypothetical protein [Truepera sp.]
MIRLLTDHPVCIRVTHELIGRVIAMHRGGAMLLGLSATDSSVTVAVPQLERVALWGWAT